MKKKRLSIPSVIKIVKDVLKDDFMEEDKDILTMELKEVKRNHIKVTIEDYWQESLLCYVHSYKLTELKSALFSTFKK